MHHVAVICENLERSLEFYQGVLGACWVFCMLDDAPLQTQIQSTEHTHTNQHHLRHPPTKQKQKTPKNPKGLELNPDRPDAKLPYRGAWLWIGPEMVHLMELPNPDPATAAARRASAALASEQPASDAGAGACVEAGW